jgi:hypothetical protein
MQDVLQNLRKVFFAPVDRSATLGLLLMPQKLAKVSLVSGGHLREKCVASGEAMYANYSCNAGC